MAIFILAMEFLGTVQQVSEMFVHFIPKNLC